MSNFLSIAAVTEGIRQMLERALQADFPESLNEPTATAIRPNAGAAALPKLGVNLYLYQVNHNAHFRNADLPTRRPDGSARQTPRAALDLHYLFSFYGEESKLEPQQVMGSVIRTLHAAPWLLPGHLAKIIATSDPLKQSDLDREIERVKLTPLPLTIEELSKIWSVFFQNSYTLSMAYTASVVFIEGKESPALPLPVKTRQVYAFPVAFPVIDQLRISNDPENPPSPALRFGAEDRLVIAGKQLRGKTTDVKIDGREIDPSRILDIKNAQILLLLPKNLRAGAHSLSVVHGLPIGDPPTDRHIAESNSAAFLLCPVMTTPSSPVEPSAASSNGRTLYTSPVAVGITPACGIAQRVSLILSEYAENPLDEPVFYSVEAPEQNGITDPDVTETSAIMFSLTTSAKPKPGHYIARVVVDGVQSPVSFDPPNPLVEIADVP